MTDSPSAAVPRRQAARIPVNVPSTIAKNVPSMTIGTVLISAVRRLSVTGWLLAKEMPRFPWASSRR